MSHCIEPSPSNRSTCAACRKRIDKGELRLGENLAAGASDSAVAFQWYHLACGTSRRPEVFADARSRFSGALPDPASALAVPAEAKAAAKTTPKRPRAEAAPVAPPIGGRSAKQVAALVAKLAKLGEGEGDACLDKAGFDAREVPSFYWDVARHGLLPPRHPVLLRRLGELAGDASAEAIFTVLPQLARDGAARPAEVSLELWPGWPLAADAVAVMALELDPARVRTLLASAPPVLAAGLHLVLGRHGEPVPPAALAELTQLLAVREADGMGLPRRRGQAGEWLQLPVLDGRGGRTWPLHAPEDLFHVLAPNAPDAAVAAWHTALGEAATAGRFASLARVLPGLVRLPLDALIPALARASLAPDESLDRQLAELLAQRDDDPQALSAAALTISRGHLRERLLLIALGRLVERGEPVPTGIEHELAWETFARCLPTWRGSAPLRTRYQRVLAALQPARAHALAAHLAASPGGESASAAVLSVHPDASLLRLLVGRLDEAGTVDPQTLAAVGAPVLPLLLDALAAAPSAPRDQRRQRLARCVEATLGCVGIAGGTFAASLDVWLSCAPGEGYWPEDRRASLRHALRAVSEPRRMATIDRLFAETKQVERPFYAVAAVSDPDFQAAAARKLVAGAAGIQDRTLLQLGLQDLGGAGLAAFAGAFVGLPQNPSLVTELRSVFGPAAVDRLLST